MKLPVVFLTLILFVSCVNGRERSFTGSTPANSAVRSFLGISQSDSIDFIRWKLSIDDEQYTIHVNYGIGKPNTNGFINGGKDKGFSGPFTKEKNYFVFQNGNKVLKALELNENLLQLAAPDSKLLVGNAGWSYALNDVSSKKHATVNLVSNYAPFRDSLNFYGRTPCNIPGLISGPQCYKIKWALVFYPDQNLSGSGRYSLTSTTWGHARRNGKWTVSKGDKGQVIYNLFDSDGDRFIYLLQLDNNLLMFTDAKGNAPVGNEDFSYVLNRQLREISLY
jgi:hypothetical protein